MKDFVKMTLAVICGILLITFALMFIGVGFISALAVSGSKTTVVPKSAVLNIDMSEFSLAEQSKETNPLESIQEPAGATIGIWDAVQAINAAAEDLSIEYIFLRPENVAAGMGHMYEFRTALENFRKSGKAVISYMDNATNGGYYMASVSDKIYMTSHEGGTSMMHGISGQLFFLKDILDKLGVNVQLIRHGKYKSAGEMFVRNSSSPENMEQNQVMISSMWHEMASEIAESRGISEEKFNALIDGLALNFPKDFLDNSLVDGLVTKEELKERLAALSVKDSFDDVKFISFADYVTAKVSPNLKAKKKIAVIYADGEIIDGFGRQDVAGDYFANQIAKVRADSTVKAVVFRVNSPGGSVLASEKIREEIDLLKEQKPLVASYGDYAASGGYWVSANSGHIFADPVSLTGSIGVFSMIPDLSGTMKNVAHVTFTPVNSNKHSDMLSLMRPFDADETRYMQDAVESIYDRFVSIVSNGRNLEPDFVDSVAQGRVWTGADALKIGLVDERGTLEDAIKWVAEAASESLEEADLANWNIVGYPKPQTTLEAMMEMINGSTDKSVFSGTALEPLAQTMLDWSKSLSKDGKSLMMARMPYQIVWD